MFAKNKSVTADGVEAVQCRPSVSIADRPTYKCRCLDCPFFVEPPTTVLKLAEQAAKNHAERYRHRVRLAMDVDDIEIEVINGEDR
jgi:hypothetical protein